MNSIPSCPRCGHLKPGANDFCPNCGTSLKSATNGGWRILFGVFALLAGLTWGAVLYTRPATDDPPAQSGPRALLAADSSLSSSPTQTHDLTAAQHLAEAKKALADGYRPDKDPRKTSWGEVAAARWHLKAIGAASPEHREARELLKEVERREREMALASKPAAPEPKPSPVAQAADDEDDLSDEEDFASDDALPSAPSVRGGTGRQAAPQEHAHTVYITRTGEKYHRAGCRYLSRSMIPISLEDARRSYGACSVCRPSQ
jgi:rubrerythrin